MKNLATLILLTLISALAFGQELTEETFENSNKELKHSVGGTAGAANGFGLTYRYWPGDFGVQATFGPVVEEDRTWISSGVTFLYSIARTKHVELFVYQGNHFLFEEDDYNRYDPWTGQSYSGLEIERTFNTGVGLGVEFIFLERINFALMAGYTAIDSFEELRITIGAGLYYNF